MQTPFQSLRSWNRQQMASSLKKSRLRRGEPCVAQGPSGTSRRGGVRGSPRTRVGEAGATCRTSGGSLGRQPYGRVGHGLRGRGSASTRGTEWEGKPRTLDPALTDAASRPQTPRSRAAQEDPAPGSLSQGVLLANVHFAGPLAAVTSEDTDGDGLRHRCVVP